MQPGVLFLVCACVLAGLVGAAYDAGGEEAAFAVAVPGVMLGLPALFLTIYLREDFREPEDE